MRLGRTPTGNFQGMRAMLCQYARRHTRNVDGRIPGDGLRTFGLVSGPRRRLASFSCGDERASTTSKKYRSCDRGDVICYGSLGAPATLSGDASLGGGRGRKVRLHFLLRRGRPGPFMLGQRVGPLLRALEKAEKLSPRNSFNSSRLATCHSQLSTELW